MTGPKLRQWAYSIPKDHHPAFENIGEFWGKTSDSNFSGAIGWDYQTIYILTIR